MTYGCCGSTLRGSKRAQAPIRLQILEPIRERVAFDNTMGVTDAAIPAYSERCVAVAVATVAVT